MLYRRDKWLLHYTFKLLRESSEDIELDIDVVEDPPEMAAELHVFDFDNTLGVTQGENYEIEKYKSLPNLNLLKTKHANGYPCYICTARQGQENVQYIQEFLEQHSIILPAEHIFVVGSEPKGYTVADLIIKHNPEQTWFYDDQDRNTTSVYESCKDLAEELHIVRMSSAILGDVIEELICGTQVEGYKKTHRLSERKVFKTWRKLGGI